MTPPSPISDQQWYELTQRLLPELTLPNFSPQSILFLLCEDLAHAADSAHEPPSNKDFLHRLYGIIRWTIHHTEDSQLQGWIADWFFDNLLDLPHAQKACLDYLNWDDVEIILASYTSEPLFDDEENFEKLCVEWKRRKETGETIPAVTEL